MDQNFNTENIEKFRLLFKNIYEVILLKRLLIAIDLQNTLRKLKADFLE